jgi:hypothetical protein
VAIVVVGVVESGVLVVVEVGLLLVRVEPSGETLLRHRSTSI